MIAEIALGLQPAIASLPGILRCGAATGDIVVGSLAFGRAFRGSADC